VIIFHTDYPVFFRLCVFTLRVPAFVSRQKLNEKQENYLVWPNEPKLSNSAIASILEPEAAQLWKHLVTIFAVMSNTRATGVNEHAHNIH